LSLNNDDDDLAIADFTEVITGGSGDLREPLRTFVLREGSNICGGGGLWSSCLAPGCWCRFFSNLEICSSASSSEDGERPRLWRSS